MILNIIINKGFDRAVKFHNNFLIKTVLFLIVGLITGYYFLDFRLLLILSVGIVILFFLFDNTKKLSILFLIFIFLFGFFYLLYYEMSYNSKYSIANYNGQVCEVIGKIDYNLDSLEGNLLNLEPILVNNKRVKYGKIQLYKDQIKSDIKQNDLVIARLKLNKPQPKRNPGGFSYYNYLKKRKVYSIGNIFEIYKIQSYPGFKNIIIKIKGVLLNAINNKISQPVNEFIKALLLGEKSSLNQNWETNFRKAGANHLLAISGLHIGFITIFLLTLLNLLTFSQTVKNIILTIFLFIYILMTGVRASVLRASFLVLIYRYCKQLNIEIEFPALISGVLFLILLINPYQLFSIGLQLSFLVLIMIISWTKLLQKYLYTGLAVSIAAQLGSMPLTAYYFNTVTPAGIITNLWAIPLISGIVFLVLIHFAFYLFIPFLSNFTGQIIYILSKFLKDGINIMSDLPSAEVKVTTPSFLTVILIYIIIFMLSYILKIKGSIKYRKKFKTLSILLIIITLITVITIILPIHENNLLNIYCLDVGQGDSIFVKLPNKKNILIDTGANIGKSSNVKRTIIPFLLNRRVKLIDYLLITHFDADHCSDSDYLIKNGFVKNLIISKKFDRESQKANYILKAAKEKNIRVLTVENEDILKFNKARLEFFAPIKESNYQSRNYNSIVFRLNYEDFEMFFPGDIAGEVELELIKKMPKELLSSDILKVAHHGSISSSLNKFIKAVKPKEAIISVGVNKYGHPSSEVLNRFKKLKTRVWRTDKSGAVIIKTDGYKYNINSYIN